MFLSSDASDGSCELLRPAYVAYATYDGTAKNGEHYRASEGRPRYSKRTENFKRPKNREDSSDLDENLTESIAAMRSIISKIFGAARLQQKRFRIFFVRFAV